MSFVCGTGTLFERSKRLKGSQKASIFKRMSKGERLEDCLKECLKVCTLLANLAKPLKSHSSDCSETLETKVFLNLKNASQHC